MNNSREAPASKDVAGAGLLVCLFLRLHEHIKAFYFKQNEFDVYEKVKWKTPSLTTTVMYKKQYKGVPAHLSI